MGHYDATKPAREKVRKAKNDGADTKIETFADDVTTRLVFEGTCDDATVERARDQTGMVAAGKTKGVGAPTKKVSAGVVSGNCVATFRTRVPTKPAADVIKDGTTAADDAAKLIAATNDLGKDKSKRRLNSGSRNLGGATSASSSATQEEVVSNDDSTSEEYPSTTTDVEVEKKEETPPKAPAVVETKDGEDEAGETILSSGSSITFATATI